MSDMLIFLVTEHYRYGANWDFYGLPIVGFLKRDDAEKFCDAHNENNEKVKFYIIKVDIK